jgi:hypothetical protein
MQKTKTRRSVRCLGHFPVSASRTAPLCSLIPNPQSPILLPNKTTGLGLNWNSRALVDQKTPVGHRPIPVSAAPVATILPIILSAIRSAYGLQTCRISVTKRPGCAENVPRRADWVGSPRPAAAQCVTARKNKLAFLLKSALPMTAMRPKDPQIQPPVAGLAENHDHWPHRHPSVR